MATTKPRDPAADPRRWAALFFIGLAQLMIVLDGTVVNIALPTLQRDLGISDGDRQWVITGYTLAFGSLLLLGGRIADYTGRKRAFLIGLLGFAAASALGGAAGSFEMLLAARALQGGFAALLGPSALSLLTVTFTHPKERAKAFGIWGAITAMAGAIGLLTGGALTEYLNWRWCLYISVPIALIAAVGGYGVLAESRRQERARFDVFGVLLVTSGLVAIVYGTSRAEADGWGAAPAVGLLGVGAVLLVAFAVVESRVPQPLLPMRLIADRTRGGAYLAAGLAILGMFGAFLFMTYYLQGIKGYSPIRTGVAFLPMTVAVLLSAGGLAPRLLPKVAPRVLIVPGMLLAASGMLWFLTIDTDTSYAQGVLVAGLLLGLGAGLIMPVAFNHATHGVDPGDAGVASASVNTAQQVGSSIGTALLNTIATSATADYLTSHAGRAEHDPLLSRRAALEGFETASTWAAGIILVGALIVTVLMNAPRPESAAAADRDDARGTEPEGAEPEGAEPEFSQS
ncbi:MULTISPECIES: MFS transporter [unclassified Streptomyces]|uniref:MFS transporter n=1 Tax=unclassified Streptomyces TaxID=2593676 RepID=UPI001369BD83|nr:MULTISPECIES: MFS transporter [unclassified Streptomyces]NEA02151.1 MFS transporter [Streptomyces sp. SID10116]MYY80062.1 DHA2 family efflux MFS transporter permease subunit [Streptomyces sp. SID335]MYZ12091.1 DHA2 family efflux MFS transporter permease subunit [Streptomyces sp. SID337]NDZ91889.1 MFS transporter [Streptomyces sp. SID10115]NEB44087.1 MFS transporter [Streptomyces sp. SID339]